MATNEKKTERIVYIDLDAESEPEDNNDDHCRLVIDEEATSDDFRQTFGLAIDEMPLSSASDNDLYIEELSSMAYQNVMGIGGDGNGTDFTVTDMDWELIDDFLIDEFVEYYLLDYEVLKTVSEALDQVIDD